MKVAEVVDENDDLAEERVGHQRIIVPD